MTKRFHSLVFAAVTICFAGNVLGQDMSKSYAVQCRAADSIFKTLYEEDSATLRVKYDKLTAKYSDDQMKDLLKVKLYYWMLKRNKRNSTFEADLIEMAKHFDRQGHDRLRAEVLNVLAEYYWNKKDLSLSLENYIYAYDISTQYTLAEFPHKAEIIYWLALRYYYFRDYDSEKKYLLEYFRIIPADYPVDRPGRINALGLCYQSLEQYDSASYYFKRGIEVSIKQNQKDWESLSRGNLAYISYLEKKYDESIALFESDTVFKTSAHMDDADALSIVGEMYYLKNNKKKALELASRAYDIIMQVLEKRKKLDYYDIKVIYPRIAKVFAGTGNPVLGYSLMEEVHTADDSVFKSRNAILMAGVQHKTDAEKHMSELRKSQEELVLQKKVRNSFIVGFSGVLLLTGLVLYQKRRIKKEKARSDELLLNILPTETAEELKDTGGAKAKRYEIVSVLFTDFKNFTELSEKLSAEELVREIDYYYSAFDEILSKYNIEKIKTIGDSYMCVSGLPVQTESHAIKAVSAGLDMLEFIDKEKAARTATKNVYFEMRIGIHSGHVVAGIVGRKKFAYDVWGDTVNVASRMESVSKEGKINISEVTYNLVKGKFSCTFRGELDAKNKGAMKMYFVDGPLFPSEVSGQAMAKPLEAGS
jgi:adenylate cyclase